MRMMKVEVESHINLSQWFLWLQVLINHRQTWTSWKRFENIGTVDMRINCRVRYWSKMIDCLFFKDISCVRDIFIGVVLMLFE